MTDANSRQMTGKKLAKLIMDLQTENTDLRDQLREVIREAREIFDSRNSMFLLWDCHDFTQKITNMEEP